jgi:hypothetical protein
MCKPRFWPELALVSLSSIDGWVKLLCQLYLLCLLQVRWFWGLTGFLEGWVVDFRPERLMIPKRGYTAGGVIQGER